MAFKFTTRTLVYEYASGESPALAPRMPDGEEWRILSTSGIGAAFGDDLDRIKRFQRYASAGHTGLLLMQDGQWVSYGWCTNLESPGPPHLPRWISRLGAYWIFGCHTRAQFRGRGIYKRLLARLTELVCKDQPWARIYIDTHGDNVPARRAILASGFKPYGVFSTYRMWVPAVGNRILGGRWRTEEPHPILAGERVIVPTTSVAGKFGTEILQNNGAAVVAQPYAGRQK